MSRHAFWLFLLVGCASRSSAMREDNRRLTDSVSELRAERRAQERKLRDLQHQLDKLRADRVESVVGALPALPVEVAAPPASTAEPAADGARVVGVTEDGTEIVYEGDAAAGKVGAWPDEPTPRSVRTVRAEPIEHEASTSDRIEVTRRVPPISARAAVRTSVRDRAEPSERSDEAAASYRSAVELVKTGQYADAVTSLRGFLGKFPRHDYADNAQYWLGEAFYAQQDFPHALAEFRTVIETYPRGNKVPDALLKVGYCYQALGQTQKSRAVLEQVVTLYPKSEPAALATKRLGESK
ncbi:MAG: tol-pal system protein YbgF [Kofleriaceae bacterium]|nr:tol-pal system protein YbgF [Kofleriaceae bacterium]